MSTADLPITSQNIDWATIGNGNSNFAKGMNYTYGEFDTGYKWLQGQTIYSQTIYFANCAARGGSVSYTIPGAQMQVAAWGVLRAKINTRISMSIPYRYCTLGFDRGTLQVTSVDTDLTNYDALVTIWYIKS